MLSCVSAQVFSEKGTQTITMLGKRKISSFPILQPSWHQKNQLLTLAFRGILLDCMIRKFQIGDSLTEGEVLKFKGIPSFSRNNFDLSIIPTL